MLSEVQSCASLRSSKLKALQGQHRQPWAESPDTTEGFRVRQVSSLLHGYHCLPTFTSWTYQHHLLCSLDPDFIELSFAHFITEN